MVKLYDEATGTVFGTISEDQFQFLVDQLEEESLDDTDYWIHPETLELLEENGADAALLAVLRDALGDREDVDIHWTRE
jgi:processive 1,2-diacylglycerol beta-glucosyltransferase